MQLDQSYRYQHPVYTSSPWRYGSLHQEVREAVALEVESRAVVTVAEEMAAVAMEAEVCWEVETEVEGTAAVGTVEATAVARVADELEG